jgi:hypothetical protein
MLNTTLSEFYERDINKLIEEIILFKQDENIWRTAGTINNSCGNLVLHIIGGMNFLIGATLGNTGYTRHRDEEFTKKDVPRTQLVAELEDLSQMIKRTLSNLDDVQLESPYPIFFDKPGVSTAYVLVQLSLHLNYHLGQVNYLRRMLE